MLLKARHNHCDVSHFNMTNIAICSIEISIAHSLQIKHIQHVQTQIISTFISIMYFSRYNISRKVFCGVIIHADSDQDEWDLPWRHCGLVYCMALSAMLLRTVIHNGYQSVATISPSIDKGDGINMVLITGCPQRERLIHTPYISGFFCVSALRKRL